MLVVSDDIKPVIGKIQRNIGERSDGDRDKLKVESWEKTEGHEECEVDGDRDRRTERKEKAIITEA